MISEFASSWRLRRISRKYGLPDLPEVRKLMRLSWWNGFTFGAFEYRVTAAREEALDAIQLYLQEQPER